MAVSGRADASSECPAVEIRISDTMAAVVPQRFCPRLTYRSDDGSTQHFAVHASRAIEFATWIDKAVMRTGTAPTANADFIAGPGGSMALADPARAYSGTATLAGVLLTVQRYLLLETRAGGPHTTTIADPGCARLAAALRVIPEFRAALTGERGDVESASVFLGLLIPGDVAILPVTARLAIEDLEPSPADLPEFTTLPPVERAYRYTVREAPVGT